MRKLRLREGKSLIQGPPENQLGTARWEARSFPDPLLIPNPHLEVKKKKKKRKRHPPIIEARTASGKRIV